MGSRCVKFGVNRSHSLILVTGSSTWHLMAKNSEDLKKRIVALHKDGVGYTLKNAGLFFQPKCWVETAG